uniref:Uncharacterized protein n=1 Tax=Fagus sylvatica TaxID=28930 RepID=A0A2N9H4N6_FAGSY
MVSSVSPALFPFRARIPSGLGPPPLGDYLPPTSVLHRLSAKLYSLSFLALCTWGELRRSMAASGSDWPAVLSEELSEGLSSSGREGEGTLFKATTLSRIRSRYQVLEDDVLRIPNSDKRACSHVEDIVLYKSTLMTGLHFPVQPFIRELLDFLSLAPGQVALNGWRVIISSMVTWKECSDGLEDITVEEFLYCFEPSQIAASPNFWTFRNRDNLERLPEEGDDFIQIRRTWGIPSPSALNHPTLTPVWKDCILRVHSLSNRQYTHYIQPELLFHHSFGPKPSAAVLSLIQTNEKRVATMKINKSKLKNIVEKGAPAVPINVKRKRTDDGQSSVLPEQSEPPPKRALTVQASPSIPPPPLVVQILDEEIAVVQATDDGPTICRSHGLAAKRAKATITELDFQEYANARTENISKLMVHSLMRSLNRAVFELNKEKRDLIGAVEEAKVELIAKDGDVKDYKTSEAFEGNNLQCFISRFKAFRKQAKEKYPDLAFTEFQPYDDTDSVNDGGEKVNDTDQVDDATT